MIVLILGTALFIGVISVRQSVDTTQAGFLRYHQYDVRVQFEQPHRMARLEAAAFELPDVVAVEGWGIGSATRLRPDDSESNRYQVYGLPEATQDGEANRAGRALAAPDDENAWSSMPPWPTKSGISTWATRSRWTWPAANSPGRSWASSARMRRDPSCT